MRPWLGGSLYLGGWGGVCDAPDRHTSGASQTLPQPPLIPNGSKTDPQCGLLQNVNYGAGGSCWRTSCQRSSVASRTPRSWRRSAFSNQRQTRSGGHSWSPSSHHSPTDRTTSVRRSRSPGAGRIRSPSRRRLRRPLTERIAGGFFRFGRSAIGRNPRHVSLDRSASQMDTVPVFRMATKFGCRLTLAIVTADAGCGHRHLLSQGC